MRVLFVTSQWPSAERPDVASFVVRQMELLVRAGVEVDVFTFHGGRDLRRYRDANREVGRRWREGGYDLVHAHYGQAGLVVPRGVLFVVSLYDKDLEGKGRSLQQRAWAAALRRFSLLVARRAAAVILASEWLKEITPRGLATRVIPPGVDLTTFRPMPAQHARTTLGLPLEPKLVLYCGGSYDRFFQQTFAAVRDLREHLNIDVMSLPNRSSTDLALHLNASDVAVVALPYTRNILAARQALASDIRVITHDVEDIAPHVRDASGCVECPDDDPKTIADCLSMALASPPPVGGAALVSRFTEDTMVSSLLQTYEHAVAVARQADVS